MRKSLFQVTPAGYLVPASAHCERAGCACRITDARAVALGFGRGCERVIMARRGGTVLGDPEKRRILLRAARHGYAV